MSISGIVVVITVEMQGLPATILLVRWFYSTFITGGRFLKPDRVCTLPFFDACIGDIGQ